MERGKRTFNTAAAMEKGTDIPFDSTDTNQLVANEIRVVGRRDKVL